MKYQVYADNAATTRLDEVAFEAMLPWLKDNYAMAGYNGNGAQLLGVITLLLYTYNDRVWLRVHALIPFEDEYVDGINVYPDNITLVVGAEQELNAYVYRQKKTHSCTATTSKSSTGAASSMMTRKPSSSVSMPTKGSAVTACRNARSSLS